MTGCLNQSTPSVGPEIPELMHVATNVTHASPDATQDMIKYNVPVQESFTSSVSQNFGQENSFVFRHPFTMLLAGPTCSGKTTWMKNLLQQAETMIIPPPRKILWFYKRWQPAYSELQSTIPHIVFVEGIEKQDPDGQSTLYIYDDLMKDTTRNSDICEMYTEGSHHCNLSVICLLQNLYHHGKENRTMNLNAQYIVLFKNPRDQQQVATLARQMYPKNWPSFLDTFKRATKEPYGYLLVDLKQDTGDDARLKTKVIKEGKNCTIKNHLKAGIQQGGGVKNKLEYNMDRSHCPCMDCGSIFASSVDVQKHVKRGCPENGDSPVKRQCINDPNEDGPDEFGWHNIVQRVYDQYNDQYSEKVESYQKNGYSGLRSREKATEDLYLKYRKGIVSTYADMLTTMHNMQRSMIHREVMEGIQSLMDEKCFRFAKALKVVLQQKSSLFDELIDSEDDNSSFGSESSSLESDSQAESEEHHDDRNTESESRESDFGTEDESSE